MLAFRELECRSDYLGFTTIKEIYRVGHQRCDVQDRPLWSCFGNAKWHLFPFADGGLPPRHRGRSGILRYSKDLEIDE